MAERPPRTKSGVQVDSSVALLVRALSWGLRPGFLPSRPALFGDIAQQGPRASPGYGGGVTPRWLIRDRSSPRPAVQAEEIKGESVQFLIAEFTALRELRHFAYLGVEKRVQFVLALQAAEVAFVGVLVSQRKDEHIIGGVALALGIPTLLLSYLAYRRALDFMIQARKYVRAMNAIRGFFVSNDSKIAGAVLLPTDPRLPRFDRIGHASTPVQSPATQVLVLVLFLSGLLTFAASWLLAGTAFNAPSKLAFLEAGASTAIVVILIALVERNRIRSSLRRAEEESRGS